MPRIRHACACLGAFSLLVCPSATRAQTTTAPTPGRLLTLAEVVARAVGVNSGLLAARQRLQKAQELISQVNAQARPQIRADATDVYSSYRAFPPSLASPAIQNPTLNVPSLTGAIMSIGVSTANSVLVVTFANERRAESLRAIDAGCTCLRPALMTALAMIRGMIPMALALGEACTNFLKHFRRRPL